VLPEDVTFDKPRQCAGPSSDLEPRHLPACGGRAAAKRTRILCRSSWYFARFTDPWNKSATTPAVAEPDDAGRPIYQRRRARDFASVLRTVLQRAMKATGHIALDEPFDGPYTQGMVVHEPYRKATATYATPAEVRIEAGPRPTAAAPSLLIRRRSRHRRPIEKMSKVESNNRRSRRHHNELRRRRRAMVMLSDRARPRSDLERRAGAGRLPHFVQRRGG